MYSLLKSDNIYGGLVINLCHTKELLKEEKEQVLTIFTLNSGENGVLRDGNALDKSHGICYLTVPITKEIVGYTLYSLNDGGSFLEQYDNLWGEHDISKSIYINQVAMHPDYQNKGSAIVMYMRILQEYRDINYLYAHVAIGNKQSMKFHCRHRFVPIGEYICPNFHGVINYKSILLEYCKKSNLNNF